MNTLPYKQKRSLLGIILIILAWFALSYLVFLGLAAYPVPASSKPILGALGVFVTVIAGLVALVSGYLYETAYILLDEDGIHVYRWRTPFWAIQSDIQWNDVEEVTSNTAGLLKSLFNVGTVLIQSASDQPGVAMNWLDNPDKLREFIDQQAALAAPNA